MESEIGDGGGDDGVVRIVIPIKRGGVGRDVEKRGGRAKVIGDGREITAKVMVIESSEEDDGSDNIKEARTNFSGHSLLIMTMVIEAFCFCFWCNSNNTIT